MHLNKVLRLNAGERTVPLDLAGQGLFLGGRLAMLWAQFQRKIGESSKAAAVGHCLGFP